MLKAGDRLPSLSLPEAGGGRQLRLRDGRGARVVATLHTGDCAACHRYAGVLTEAAPEVGAWSGRIILVAHRTDRLDLRRLRDAGVRVVEDPKRVMVVDEASVAIADEWGEIFFAVAADDIHSLPSADEIADWVRFISIQCPECEAPEGEWRAL